MRNFIKLLTLINFIVIISFNISKTKTDSNEYEDEELHESPSQSSIQYTTEITTQSLTTSSINLPNVIVWELCGPVARAKKTKIFNFNQKDEKTLSVWYDPTITSLIFELDESETIIPIVEPQFDLLFFSFEQKDKIQILVGCPKYDHSKAGLKYDLTCELESVQLFENSYTFTSLEKAFSNFKCMSKLTVFPGVVVHFTDELDQNVTWIFSIINQDSSSLYSFIYAEKSLLVYNQNKYTTIQLDEKLEHTFFLYFRHNGVEVYLKCPFENKPIGIWETNVFKGRVNLKTSRQYQLAYGGSNNLMQAMCAVNSIQDQLDEDSVLRKDLELIEKSNWHNSVYFPNQYQFEKIDFFKNIHILNSAYLMSPIHRILIASRVEAKQRFFDRPIKDYINGFTDGANNFWIGLSILNEVTNKYNFTLRLETDDGNLAEEYKVFKVGNESDGFKLTISSALMKNCDGFKNHENLKFSTFDFGPNSVQASNLKGGFWHKSDKNHFCLTCENLTSSNGTSALVYNFGNNRNSNNNYNYYQSESYTKILKMYLIP